MESILKEKVIIKFGYIYELYKWESKIVS